jgi:hypothetical protein
LARKKERKKDKKGQRAHSGSTRVVVTLELAQIGTTRMGVRVMSYSYESGGNESSDTGEQDSVAQGDVQADPDETLHALDELERFHERDREEFARMAAVQELGPQLREALDVLLALSPEALTTLAGIARLPADQKRVVRRAVSLPDEVKAALRGLLDD